MAEAINVATDPRVVAKKQRLLRSGQAKAPAVFPARSPNCVYLPDMADLAPGLQAARMRADKWILAHDMPIQCTSFSRYSDRFAQFVRCSELRQGPAANKKSPQGLPAGFAFRHYSWLLFKACRDIDEECTAAHVVARTNGDIERLEHHVIPAIHQRRLFIQHVA